MQLSEILNLSIGDVVPQRRLSESAYSGAISLHGKPVSVSLSAEAVRSAANSHLPILAELELYFSCFVRKQMRFCEIRGKAPGGEDYARVIPGFYASFRAVTTKHCTIAGLDGKAPPVEAMPVKRPRTFVPDWIRIDFHAGQWRGEYGY